MRGHRTASLESRSVAGGGGRANAEPYGGRGRMGRSGHGLKSPIGCAPFNGGASFQMRMPFRAA